MDLPVILGTLALLVSIAALGASSVLAARQARLLNHANHIPAVIELLTEFRTVQLHDRYAQIVDDLSAHSPTLGITRLPPDIRAAALDVAYYYQTFASLIGLGVLDERRTLAMLRTRFVKVWDALEPFVVTERASNPNSGPRLLSILEYYANIARELPDDPIGGLLGPRPR